MSDDFDDFELDGEDDLANVPTSSDPEPGTYLVSIVKMEKKARRDGQGNYISIQFRIEDVLDESLEKVIGRSIYDIYNLGSEALWKIKGVIVACRGEEAAAGNRIPNLTHERLVLDAYSETYLGRENLRTRKYRTAKKWVGLNVDCTAEPEGEDEDQSESEKVPPKSGGKSSEKPGGKSSEKPGGKSQGEVEI